MLSAKARLWRWVLDEVVHAPVEPILHPSRYRLLWIGAFTFIGHLVIYGIWGHLVPQPYENVWAPLVMAFLALIYVLPRISRDPSATESGRLFSLATWIQLPWFFTWMYWMNGGNAAWLGSVAAMILIYYHATDWRLATLGLITGGIAGWVTAEFYGGSTRPFEEPMANLVVITFAWLMGLMLGFSSANLRRARLLNTLSTMGVVAHELRTPLSVIRGRLEGIIDGIYSENGPQVSMALDQTYVLERLVEDLRLLTLAESRQLPFDRHPVDLGQLVDRTLDVFSAEAREKNISLAFTERSGDLTANVDPQRFEQVLGNLVGNAIRYVPEGGRVWVTAHSVADGLSLTVNDNGPGLPPEDLPFIFDRFWRKDKSRARVSGGTGLGLAIARQLVEAQGGHISARNLPEGGLQITIGLKYL